MAATESQLPTDPKYDQYDFPTTAPEAQPGHPGHTTPEQDAKVHQLRAELEKLGYTKRLDTLTLLRFLRARKFDVEAAKAMYVLEISPQPGKFLVVRLSVVGGNPSMEVRFTDAL